MADSLPTHMTAVYLRGYGGPEMLDVVSDAPVPSPGEREVLIKVAAAGVNNTDINTRTGWYAREVTGGSNDTAAGTDDVFAAFIPPGRSPSYEPVIPMPVPFS